MADNDQAFVGRCKDCGKLHGLIVVTPRTAGEISESIKEWEDDGLDIEQTTVGAARPEFAFCTNGKEG
jgi:hypothetical protein